MRMHCVEVRQDETGNHIGKFTSTEHFNWILIKIKKPSFVSNKQCK